MTDTLKRRPDSLLRFVVIVLLCAAMGWTFGYFLRPIADAVGLSLADLDAFADRLPNDVSFVAAGFVALLYVAFGIFGFAITAKPAIAGKDDGFGGTEDVVENRRSYFWQSTAMTAFGVALLALVLAMPMGAISRPVGAAVFVAAMAIGVGAYRRCWQLYDELLRTMTLEASAFAYFAMLAGGGGWAALGHLGLVEGPELLDWITLFWIMGIVSTVWVAARRDLIDVDPA